MTDATNFQEFKPTLIRLGKYLIVGVGSNAALYGLYLLLSMWGALKPLVSATIVYAIGITFTYLGNTYWSFKANGGTKSKHTHNVPRYIATYLVGYVVQITMLWTVMRLTPIPHQFAQLVAMVSAAGSIFLLLNAWVYPNTKHSKS